MIHPEEWAASGGPCADRRRVRGPLRPSGADLASDQVTFQRMSDNQPFLTANPHQAAGSASAAFQSDAPSPLFGLFFHLYCFYFGEFLRSRFRAPLDAMAAAKIGRLVCQSRLKKKKKKARWLRATRRVISTGWFWGKEHSLLMWLN